MLTALILLILSGCQYHYHPRTVVSRPPPKPKPMEVFEVGKYTSEMPVVCYSGSRVIYATTSKDGRIFPAKILFEHDNVECQLWEMTPN